MKRKAIFFDRDNTLIVSDGYLGDPSKVVLVDGAAATIARARRLGFITATFSNQSGVARGMFDEEDVRAVNARMDEMLRSENREALLERHDFCPFHPQAPVEQYRRDSELRKPMPGMLMNAAKALDIDLSQSWVIGDAPRDIEAGQAAGCRTILFRDPALPASPASKDRQRVMPEATVKSLLEAIDYIEKNPDPPAAKSAGNESDSVAKPDSISPADVSRSETLLSEILRELRHAREQPHVDFSVSKLLAGIAQVVSLAAAFIAYLNRNEDNYVAILLVAIWLQVLTATLLVMGRSK